MPVLFAAVLFFDVVFCDQLIPAHTGGTFGRSSREPKFKIEFHPEDSPFHPDDDQESIVMPNKNGEKFLCFLPKMEKSKSGKIVAQQNISSMIVESETRMKLKTPDELLEVLKDRCFIRQEGWWSYEFCYQNRLRQIHSEGDKVRFVCSEPRAMISSITELSTCKYALTFQCPTLCKHPLFHEERPVSHTVHCNALPKEEPKAEAEAVAEADSFRGGKITMVTDIEYSPTLNIEHAT
ncbi:UNVERIFIED_CONTAM: protein OS-9 [Sesamum angustifolium]|uniref:Protein OS-9 n=1 Tax=Sesamum angustifolium TaxID=2727405 RepID=A0AAW2PPY6_9LAMI